MASKFDPSQLTSGMTMGINFISALSKKIVEHGGNPILIHQLTIPSGGDRLDMIAKAIVAMHFPILRCQIETAALETARESYEDDPVACSSDSMYAWGATCLERTYGVPEIEFADNDDNRRPIPKEIKEQIIGKPLTYPLLVRYQEVQYVATWLSSNSTISPLPSDVLQELHRVGIAEAKYFDLDN